MKRVVLGALLLAGAGCATAAGVNDFSGGVAWTPTPELTAQHIALADQECPVAAADVSAPPVANSAALTHLYGGIGAAIGVAIGDTINQSRADAAARDRAVVSCYVERGFVPIELTADERRQWRSLSTVEARRSFTQAIIAADSSRLDEKWRLPIDERLSLIETGAAEEKE